MGLGPIGAAAKKKDYASNEEKAVMAFKKKEEAAKRQFGFLFRVGLKPNPPSLNPKPSLAFPSFRECRVRAS